MKIIVGAMHEELMTLVKDINAKEVKDEVVKEFYSEERDTVVAIVGIGISNASLGLSHILTKYSDKNIEWVLNAGTSGCTDTTLKRGDFVIVDKASYSTADSTGQGYIYGQLPQMPQYYEADKTLRTKLEEALKDEPVAVVGNDATSDMFFQSFDKVESFAKKLPFDTKIAEMECAGFFETAYKFKTPIAAVKIVSDIIGDVNPNEEQFDKFLPKAAVELSRVVRKLI